MAVKAPSEADVTAVVVEVDAGVGPSSDDLSSRTNDASPCMEAKTHNVHRVPTNIPHHSVREGRSVQAWIALIGPDFDFKPAYSSLWLNARPASAIGEPHLDSSSQRESSESASQLNG